jgi:hypothetical protein
MANISNNYSYIFSYVTFDGTNNKLTLTNGGNLTTSGFIQAVNSSGGYLMGVSNGTDVDFQITITAALAGTKYASIGPSGSQNLMISRQGGNVGIGNITSADAKLVIAQNNGNSSTFNYLTFRNIAGGYGTWSVSKRDANDLAFTYGTDSDTPDAGYGLYLKYGGNVGIGGVPVDNRLRITSGNTGESTAHLALTTIGYSGFHWLDATAYWIGQNSDARQVRVYSGSNIYAGVYLAAGGTSWTGYSDERMKTNLVPINNGVEKVLQLRAMTGRYKTDKNTRSRSFLIAQDVIKVLPEAVTINNDEIKSMGVQYTDIIPLLVKAIQELKSEIEILKIK